MNLEDRLEINDILQDLMAYEISKQTAAFRLCRIIDGAVHRIRDENEYLYFPQEKQNEEDAADD